MKKNVREAPTEKKEGSAVGEEAKADMVGVGLEDNVMAGDHSLRGAMKHLHSEHPIAWDDLGPHHSPRASNKIVMPGTK
jgi:hypothetical protein